MKITYISPGTGGAFYCENCVRDHALMSGFRALGHDVNAVSMYLPAKETNGADPVMFGAVRLYLIDKFPFLKRVPEKLLCLLDRRGILDVAASFAGATRAGGHEKMTIEMIMGEEGVFADEFDKTADYLLAQKPDVIFLSNAFLLGIASAIKAKSSAVTVACMLQDEHVWVDASNAVYRDKTWEAIAKKFRSADVLYAHSNWFGEKIAAAAGIAPDAVSIIPLGVDPVRYINTPASAQMSIGYISRLCRDMGMDTLAEAYCRLLQCGVCDSSSALEFCGGYTKDDAAVVRASRKKITRAGGRANIRKNFDINNRAALLSSVSLLSVPTRVSIALGGFIIEAMAAGVPVVQPDNGGFSEIIAETGAGRLYSPNTPEALAAALEKAVRDETSRKAMSEAGRRAVLEKYNNIEMARQALALCKA